MATDYFEESELFSPLAGTRHMFLVIETDHHFFAAKKLGKNHGRTLA